MGIKERGNLHRMNSGYVAIQGYKWYILCLEPKNSRW